MGAGDGGALPDHEHWRLIARIGAARWAMDYAVTTKAGCAAPMSCSGWRQSDNLPRIGSPAWAGIIAQRGTKTPTCSRSGCYAALANSEPLAAWPRQIIDALFAQRLQQQIATGA